MLNILHFILLFTAAIHVGKVNASPVFDENSFTKYLKNDGNAMKTIVSLLRALKGDIANLNSQMTGVQNELTSLKDLSEEQRMRLEAAEARTASQEDHIRRLMQDVQENFSTSRRSTMEQDFTETQEEETASTPLQVPCRQSHQTAAQLGEELINVVRNNMITQLQDMMNICGKEEWLDTRDNDFWTATALHNAVGLGWVEGAAILLQHGANLEARTLHQSTPLLVAAEHSQADTVRWLLQQGADVDAAAGTGWTAAHFAAYADHVPTLRVLADAADLTLTDAQDMTPLKVAEHYGSTAVIAWFNAH